MKSTDGLRTWVEVDRSVIAKNYREFRRFLGRKTKLLAVVKSNAYGHSLVDFAREMERLGTDWLGVDSIVEGIALRKEGIKTPILVLGYTLPERLSDAAMHRISVSLSHMDHIREAVRSGERLSVHIKVDTGMHRQGFLKSEIGAVISHLTKSKKNLIVEGLYTHFASAKNPAFPAHTLSQIAEFEVWQKEFSKAGFSFIAHAAATAGAMLFTQAHFDMVRIGIGLYGLWPSKEAAAYLCGKMMLTPVLSWKSLVSEVKTVKKGEKVGYDCTETLLRDSTLAICPVGYWHGYPRALSSIGFVLVRGVRCKILGRVSMDMLILDVTDAKGAAVHDEVTLIGTDGKSEVSVYDIADTLDASWYEIVTRINPLIKRIYR